MTVSAAHIQSIASPASLARRGQGAPLLHSVGVTTRDGVLPAGGTNQPLAVSSTSGLNLTVRAGQAQVTGYSFINDADITNLAIAAGGASARWDLVIARVKDTEAGDASSAATIEVVQGTTTADPAIPARSLVLARVVVAALANSVSNANITDLRVYTTAVGGALRLPGAIGGVPGSSLPPGTPVWDETAGALAFVVDAATWRVFRPSDYVIPWTPLTVATNWSTVAAGVPGLRYRRVNDRIEFSGANFYTGSIGLAGVFLVSTATPALVTGRPTAAIAGWNAPVLGSNVSAMIGAAMGLRLDVDGKIAVQASATVTNPVVSFHGAMLFDA